MVVGGGLMLEIVIADSLAAAGLTTRLISSVLAVGCSIAALYFLSDELSGLDNWNLPLFFVAILGGLMLIGLPIAFVFGLCTFAYLAFTTSTPLSIVIGQIDHGISNPILLAIPLFVLLGKTMEATGMARSIVGFLVALVGHLRGGLSYSLLAAMYVVSGISGAKTADMAAIAPVLLPEMRRRGAQGGELVSLLAASAVMSETIPPSLVLIVIATTVGLSISALFTAGLLPALFAALALCLLVFFRSRKEPISSRRASKGEIFKAFWMTLPGLILPFVIRGAVVGGVATATEVSTIGIAYTVTVCLLLGGSFPWRRLFPMLVDTATTSGVLLLILGAANAMAWALTQSGFSDDLGQAVKHMPGGATGFMICSILIFVILGSVLEGLPAIALFGPLLFPIARSLGINEVHFAMVTILAMGVGLYAPPFGVGYYSACAIGGVNPEEGMRKIWPYIGLLLCVVIVVAFVPWLSTVFL